MAANRENITAKVKRLGTLEALYADPRLSTHIRNLYPLTGKAGNTRKTKATLGKGAYGRVNLEELNEGNVATKYFLSEDTMCENISEVVILKYIKDIPNVAQLIRIDPRPTALAIDEIAPSIAENLSFPAVVMGKAVGTLDDTRLYKSWDDVYSTVVQVLQGYYMLHSLGIIHRDTKPQNMLMTATGEVWITDFGMAKYLDKNIPMNENTYTGTRLYAAPELLMNASLEHLHTDYYKSDAWAVGASIFQIVTGNAFNEKYPFRGYEIEDMIDSIFAFKGEPNKSDGDFYKLYTEYESLNRVVAHKRDDDIISKRIKSEVIFRPGNDILLEQIANILDGLLTYNPEKRMTIAQALQSLVKLPTVPPRPRLTDEYVTKVSSPNVNSAQLDLLFNWLYDVIVTATRPDAWFTPKSRAIVLDRAGVYTMAFLNKYKDSQYIKPSNIQIIGIVGFYIAACLFDGGSMDDIEFIRYYTVNAYNRVQIQECIKLYMVADIDFYGRTLLDELLDASPTIDSEYVETYGLLNFVCFQKNIFPSYVGREDILKKKISNYINHHHISRLNYLSKNKIKVGSGKTTHEKISAFLTYLSTSGGRRTVSKTKKYKKRA